MERIIYMVICLIEIRMKVCCVHFLNFSISSITSLTVLFVSCPAPAFRVRYTTVTPPTVLRSITPQFSNSASAFLIESDATLSAASRNVYD